MKRLYASILVTSLLLVISACHSSNNPVLAANVVGYTVAAATAKLQLSGLVLGTQTTAHDAAVPSGEIISQFPAAGTSVDSGSAIDVVVSSGPVVAPQAIARPSPFDATSDSLAPAAVAVRGEGLAGVMHSFIGTGSVGGAATPAAGLTLGTDGNFYGVSAHGGAYQEQGAFFRFTPEGAQAMLYSFGARHDDAIEPDATLIRGVDGNFYGTSAAGGNYGQGTVYKITPAGVETVLFSFSAGAGNGPATPMGGMIQGPDGNFFGTTRAGGANGTGVVFKLTPAGTLSVLYSFGPSRTGDSNDDVNGITH
jgi:uncharacterized repeat protein (TIGR03803 family)